MGKIPVFYGNPGEDPEAYLREFKRACISNGDRKPKEWTELLPSFLEGRALKWAEEQNEELLEDWDKLCSAILDEFLPEEKYELLLILGKLQW